LIISSSLYFFGVFWSLISQTDLIHIAVDEFPHLLFEKVHLLFSLKQLLL